MFRMMTPSGVLVQAGSTAHSHPPRSDGELWWPVLCSQAHLIRRSMPSGTTTRRPAAVVVVVVVNALPGFDLMVAVEIAWEEFTHLLDW